MTRPGLVHNVIAHPLLVLCPPVGEWLHIHTNPLSTWQRNHQINKENTMNDTTRRLRIERRPHGGAVLLGPGVSGSTITDPEVIAAIEQQLNNPDPVAQRADKPATVYTDQTPLAQVLDLLEATASDHLAFAAVIQERLNQVLDQRVTAFSDFEQDCRQQESPLVDRLYRLNDILDQAAKVNNGTIARLTI